MNKIRVVNNMIIPSVNDDVLIRDNEITFLNNGNYYIDYIDCDNISFKINVIEDICINLFEYSNCNDICINNSYYLNKRTSLILSKFSSNESTRENINIYLNDCKSSIKYNFSSVSNGKDKYVINIYHLSNNTSSDIYNRTIAKEGSSNVFDINSYVNNGINDCYLKQETKIVTLGESNNKINPNMFIGEDSTIGIHSSTIGSISEEELFYLMSRGISYRDSINLIIKGMIISNVNPDMETRSKILNILDNLGGE